MLLLNSDHLTGLSLLQLSDKLLDEVISFFDQLLIRHIKLVLVEEILRAVPALRELTQLGLK